MRVSDLVPPAEVLPYAYVNRVELIRTKPDATREIYAIDLQKVWQGNYTEDLYLEPRDLILIPSESRVLGAVTLAGEVKRPGTYPIVQGERLSSVLARAGGFTEDAYPRGAVFIREQLRRQQQAELERFIRSQEEMLLLESARSTVGAVELTSGSREEVALIQHSVQQRRQLLEILKAKVVLGRLMQGTPDDIPLEGGDSLSIPKQPSSVLVFGNVRNPTAVVYEPGKDVEFFLNRAGGLNKDADKAEIYIVKADGSAIAGFLKLRKIESGDIIVVPTKVEAKVRTLPVIKDVATILGQFALTIGVLAALL
jgi:protein involved in polysaccharide export with SLBB domain